MPHNRKLVVGGVALVKQRLRNTIPALNSVRDEIEKILIESDFFRGAPFSWISLIIRYGLKNSVEPIYQRIDKKDGDLPISVEIDIHQLLNANADTIKKTFELAAVNALLHVAHKYHLPSEELKGFQVRLQQK